MYRCSTSERDIIKKSFIHKRGDSSGGNAFPTYNHSKGIFELVGNGSGGYLNPKIDDLRQKGIGDGGGNCDGTGFGGGSGGENYGQSVHYR